MIKPKLTLQNFQQNLEIEQHIGQRMGYKLSNRQFSPKAKPQYRKQQIIINQGINPLQVIEKQIEPSHRLKELNNQIEQLQIQKKISRMAMEEDREQLNVSEILNNKIRQYNYLIDHKHLSNRKYAKSNFESVIKDKQKQKDKKSVLQKLKQKQQQLNKTGTILSKVNKAREIYNIYREYSLSIKLNPQSKIISQMDRRNKKVQNTFNYKSLARTKQVLQNVNKFVEKHRRYDNQINVQYPYASKKFMDSSKQLNNNIRRSQQINQIMSQKLSRVKSLSFSQRLQKSEVRLSQSKTSFEPLVKNSSDNYENLYNQLQRKLSNKKDSKSQQKKQQKSYLLCALRKRSPKYVKAEDSKFVTRYKVEKLAEQMIEGSGPKKKKQVELNIPKMYNRKLKVPQQLSEQDQMVMKMMIEEEDDAYYWTTCRNQKINLMLKGKKHH